ncbi:MAG: hypothetical protein ACYSTI_06435 [Planctomycetota bacterium]|jgi:hypothetical protein
MADLYLREGTTDPIRLNLFSDGAPVKKALITKADLRLKDKDGTILSWDTVLNPTVLLFDHDIFAELKWNRSGTDLVADKSPYTIMVKTTDAAGKEASFPEQKEEMIIEVKKTW